MIDKGKYNYKKLLPFCWHDAPSLK